MTIKSGKHSCDILNNGQLFRPYLVSSAVHTAFSPPLEIQPATTIYI